MNKNKFCPLPPMGWNSYDYYDTSVTEDDIKKNADYMATNMKEFGWNHIVVDIEWYSYHAGSRRSEYQYIPFEKVAMDEFSRLLPCPDRFPSAKDGAGFAPLAKYIHDLGLKFGIHIMRGIPRYAAHMHTPIKGCDKTASDIAGYNNICEWNPDMYGIDVTKEGAQEYYDSLMELYAQWGVDFIKCDDICRMDMPTAKDEIVMLHKAIEKCGRPITLSLSPGPAKIDEAWHYEKYANMWRITDDFWDEWHHLKNMFYRCEVWERHVSQGCYPDCDMIPVGKVGKGFNDLRDSCFSPAEQRTMLSLWCIFGSPLMLGCELPLLDADTLARITNAEVLSLLQRIGYSHQISRTEKEAIWISAKPEENFFYVALFNLDDKDNTISLSTQDSVYYLPENIHFDNVSLHNLWTKEDIVNAGDLITATIKPHDVALYKVQH